MLTRCVVAIEYALFIQEAQVTITDHHTVTDSFIRHMEKEVGQWSH